MRFPIVLLTTLLCGWLSAQVPQAFDFQAVARDASGNVLGGRDVSVRLSVHSGTIGGAVVYQETHAVTTNAFGLFHVGVGQGSAQQGAFALVAWGAQPHFLQVELDADGGSDYADMGTTQLLSVPYALHAGSVPCATVSMLGDTLKQANGCHVIIPGLSAANGGCRDVDEDGFYDRIGCNTPVDCDDTVASIHPAAEEICGNGVDEDCSGTPDDSADPAAFLAWHPDADGDGFGSTAITVMACAAPEGHLLNGEDCDDTDADILPGQGCSAVCTTEEFAWLDANFTFYRTALMNAFGNCFFDADPEGCMQAMLEGEGIPLSGQCNSCGFGWITCIQENCLGQCVQGPASCNACALSSGCTASLLQCIGLVDADNDGTPAGSDCDDNDATRHASATELCDGIDNDCDGLVDEGNACCPDNDQDGFTTCDGDCDDNDNQNNPGAGEVCDLQDNNCDGQIDEGVLNYRDADQDGFGDPAQLLPCQEPGVPNALDCDDTNANVFPGQGCFDCSPADVALMASDPTVLGADPTCLQDHCSSPSNPVLCLADCIQVNGLSFSCAVCIAQYRFCVADQCPACATDPTSPDCLQCLQSSGCAAQFTACSGLADADQDGHYTPLDCNDADAAIHPDATEVCNGIDDNCDGQVDESCPALGQPCDGADDDACANGTVVCDGLGGCACDEAGPGNTEVCNGNDDDCDGEVDEGGVCDE